MTTACKTVVITGASQGIGAGIARLFIDRGYNVVANSRGITRKSELQASPRLALVEGDIGLDTTAARIVETALERFGSLDALVNNAGIFISKPFVDYTPEDVRALFSTNVDGFIYITQRAIKQFLAQGNGGSVVNITASIADHPAVTLPASIAMITKGGLNAITRSLALEHAKNGIRVNAVAPGVVGTPLLENVPKDFLRSLSPLAQIAEPKDIAEAVLYLTEASQVTGEVLAVNGGAHLGKW